MKATLTVPSRGVVTLPAKHCTAQGIQADDQIMAEAIPEGIPPRPTVTLPIEMYSPARVQAFDDAEAGLAAVLPKEAAGRSSTNPMRNPARKPLPRKSTRSR